MENFTSTYLECFRWVSPRYCIKTPSQHTDWIDIYNRLFRERIVFIGQRLTHDLMNHIMGVLLFLDAEDSSKPINVYINSPESSVTSLAVFDTMQHIKSEIVTINLGVAASLASFILAAGTKGKRFGLKHSRVLIHQPIGGFHGQAEDIKVEAAQIMRIKQGLIGQYSLLTGQPQEKIKRDIGRDKFMSAEEAKEYGLIDHVIEAKDPRLMTI